jgi:hypothetical protein
MASDRVAAARPPKAWALPANVASKAHFGEASRQMSLLKSRR